SHRVFYTFGSKQSEITGNRDMVFQVQRSGRKNELMMPVGGASPRILFIAAVKTSLCGVGGSPLKTVPALMFSVVFLLIASRNRGHRLFH
ncbi:hypothetical protein ZWY2020_010404, partial [Hordeum vulgare]